jgi:hypothetical protein
MPRIVREEGDSNLDQAHQGTQTQILSSASGLMNTRTVEQGRISRYATSTWYALRPASQGGQNHGLALVRSPASIGIPPYWIATCLRAPKKQSVIRALMAAGLCDLVLARCLKRYRSNLPAGCISDGGAEQAE